MGLQKKQISPKIYLFLRKAEAKQESETLIALRWLKTVSSTFQDLDFDVSL